jgi:hypothetical protein
MKNLVERKGVTIFYLAHAVKRFEPLFEPDNPPMSSIRKMNISKCQLKSCPAISIVAICNIKLETTYQVTFSRSPVTFA